MLFVACASYALVREALTFFGGAGARRVRLASLVITFASCGVFVALSFLPVGAIGAAVVTALLVTLFRDGVSAHFHGVLVRSFVLRGALIFAVTLIIVFASVPWSVR
jgi:hypothetical protein